MRIRTLALFSLAFCPLPGGPVYGGAQGVPCEEPHVFPNAAVNVVVLPYLVPPELQAAGGTGNELAALAQQEILSAIAKFGSVGAVQLTSGTPRDNRVCDPETVRTALLGSRPGAVTTVGQGQGLVLLWGTVAQEGGALYLQSFVHFLRRDTDELLTVPIDGLPFRVKTTAQSFGFVPRKITITDLASIRQEFAATRTLHKKPQKGSASMNTLPIDKPFHFLIDDTRDGWMHVLYREKPSEPPKSGWMQVRSSEDGKLRTLMPELSFVEGVVGYLAYRVRSEGTATSGGQVPGVPPDARRRSMLVAAETAIENYVRNLQQGAVVAGDSQAKMEAFRNQPLAMAVPMQLLGLMALLRGETDSAVLERVHERVEAAAALVPYRADARNLEVVVRLFRDRTRGQGEFDGTRELIQMQRALGAEPANTAVLANLKNLYRLVLRPAGQLPSGWRELTTAEHEALQQQLSSLEHIGG